MVLERVPFAVTVSMAVRSDAVVFLLAEMVTVPLLVPELGFTVSHDAVFDTFQLVLDETVNEALPMGMVLKTTELSDVAKVGVPAPRVMFIFNA